MPRLTLYGMDNYLDGAIIRALSLPNGITYEMCYDALMRRCGQLYPYRQVPAHLLESVRLWSLNRLPAWNRIAAALTAEYNPIENYDRRETIHHEDHRNTESAEGENTSSTSSGQSGGTSTGSSTSSSTTTADDTTTAEHMVSAFDSSSYTPRGQDITSVTGSTHGSASATDSTEETVQSSTASAGKRDSTRKESDTGGYDDTIHAHGNIGVTTNQSMITKEIELRRANLLDIMAGEFEREFIVEVY